MDALSLLSEFEHATIEVFVRIAQLLGIPKSIGEIYGLLFVSARPLSFEGVIEKLAMSKGSASQGLKVLRGIGAVRLTYVAGDRRDHYLAETGLRKLAAGVLREKLEPHLISSEDRLLRLRALLDTTPVSDRELLSERIQTLRGWQQKTKSLLPLVMTALAAEGNAPFAF